jgi:adenylate kinase family enzyme
VVVWATAPILQRVTGPGLASVGHVPALSRQGGRPPSGRDAGACSPYDHRVPETDRVEDARRILVYGATGSGKSVMARRLSELTGIPWTSVDDICWSPGWVQMPQDEQVAHFDALTREDSWLLDTAYGGWRHLAHERADLVVALDYARLTSLTRLLRRTATRILDRQEICNGNHESWRTVFARDSLVVWHFTSFRSKRTEMRAWATAASGPPVITLRRPAHARSFVEAEEARRGPTRTVRPAEDRPPDPDD